MEKERGVGDLSAPSLRHTRPPTASKLDYPVELTFILENSGSALRKSFHLSTLPADEPHPLRPQLILRNPVAIPLLERKNAGRSRGV